MKTYQGTTLLRYKFNHTHAHKMTTASHGIQENELDA